MNPGKQLANKTAFSIHNYAQERINTKMQAQLRQTFPRIKWDQRWKLHIKDPENLTTELVKL